MFPVGPQRRRKRPGKDSWDAVAANAETFHNHLLKGHSSDAYFRHPVLREYLLHEELRPKRVIVSSFIRSEIRLYLNASLNQIATRVTAERRTRTVLATAFPDTPSVDQLTDHALADYSNRRYSLKFPAEPVHNWARVLKGRSNDRKKIELVAQSWFQMLASVAIAGVPYKSSADDGSTAVETAIAGLNDAANRSMKRHGITWNSRLTEYSTESNSKSESRNPKPKSRLIRNPHEAELVAAEWIRYWGWSDARVSKAGSDEGIDVEGKGVVAQVKAHMVPIGRPDVQNLVGVASVIKKTPIFFSLTDYTPQAVSWANLAGVALFGFDLQGKPRPINATASKIAER